MKAFIKNYLMEQDVFYECMLLEYYYSESNRSFTWVGRPGLFTNVGLAKNPFLKICFGGVYNYNHIPNSNRYFDCKNHFFTQNYQGAYESHNSYLKKNIDFYEIEIEMTFNLGSIFFQFNDFSIEILNTECEKLNDSSFRYSHPETKEEIDFDRPFGEIMRD